MGMRRESLRVAKFSVVGTAAFVVDFGIFNLLLLPAVGMGPIWAKSIAVVLATLVSWLGSRYWTFCDGRNPSKSMEAVAFFLTNAGGLLIALLCLWVSHYLLELTSVLADNISGNIVGVLLGNVFRYFMYRFVIFSTRRADRRQVIELDGGKS